MSRLKSINVDGHSLDLWDAEGFWKNVHITSVKKVTGNV